MATPKAGAALYSESETLTTATMSTTTSAPASISSGLLRGETALTVDVDTFPHGDITYGSDGGPDTSRRNSRRDYVARRLTYWGMDVGEQTKDEIAFGAVHSLPLSLQAAFRRKMLAVFALQLAFVTALVAACAFYPPVTNVVTTAFAVKVSYLIAAASALVVLLLLLYAIRLLWPLNWLVLLVFSGAQAALFAALGVKYDTHLGVFNCGATLACVVIMLLLAGVQRPRRGWCSCCFCWIDLCIVCCDLCSCLCDDDSSRCNSNTIDDDDERDVKPPALLSTFVTGLIAYVVVALVASALFVTYGAAFVTREGFGASLAFQFVLVLWFALDASTMYHVLSPDEYMHGVIYFYTDMVLLVVMCAAAAGVIAIGTAAATACEGDCNCGDCGDCGGCCSCGSCSDTRVCGIECGCCECNPLSPCDDRWTWSDMCYWCDCLCRCWSAMLDSLVCCAHVCDICCVTASSSTTTATSQQQQQLSYASMNSMNDCKTVDACAVADVQMQRV